MGDVIDSAGSGSRRASSSMKKHPEAKFRATTRTQAPAKFSPVQAVADPTADFNAAFAREVEAVSVHGMRNSHVLYQKYQEA